jgi:hypothetical protein
MSNNDISDKLARNARAFFMRATMELEKSPRHAIVDLCVGLELLMKARLAHEHWGFLPLKAGDISLQKVKEGDFKSVGIDEALGRIECITGYQLPKADTQLMDAVVKHRNRVVHFYHDDLDADDPALREKAALEQCRIWLVVDRLITKDWADAFGGQRLSWSAIRDAFKENRNFLKQKFDSVSATLAGFREIGGISPLPCRGCGFNATKIENHAFGVQSQECLVCSNGTVIACVECPRCEFVYTSPAEIAPYCSNCDQDLWAAMGLASEASGYCENCFLYEEPTVRESLGGGESLCAACLAHGEPEQCRFCGKYWIGLPDSQLEHGCYLCTYRG